MNLWIRSQDKECLTNISNIQYVYKNNMHGLGTYYDNLKILGTYKTKERVLEVLNEIQELLMPKIVFKDEGRDYITPQGQIYKLNIKQPISTDIQQLSTYVYEMPEN